MIFSDHYPICSFTELREMVSTRSFFFFPIKSDADIRRFNSLQSEQYTIKIDIYLSVMGNVN